MRNVLNAFWEKNRLMTLRSYVFLFVVYWNSNIWWRRKWNSNERIYFSFTVDSNSIPSEKKLPLWRSASSDYLERPLSLRCPRCETTTTEIYTFFDKSNSVSISSSPEMLIRRTDDVKVWYIFKTKQTRTHTVDGGCISTSIFLINKMESN